MMSKQKAFIEYGKAFGRQEEFRRNYLSHPCVQNLTMRHFWREAPVCCDQKTISNRHAELIRDAWEKRAAYRIERHCGNCGRCNHEADMWGEVNSFCTLPTRACFCVTDAPDDFCCNYWEPRKEENEK